MPDLKAEAINITVESITPRGKYSSIKSGDTYYNVWDSLVLERLKLGESYSVMITSKTSIDPNTQQPKTFHNIVGLSHPNFEEFEQSLEAVAQPAVIPPKSISKPSNVTPLNFMIDVRKTALTNATTMLIAGLITQKAMDKTLQEYERYIVSGLKVEQKSNTAIDAPLDLNEFVD